MTIDYSQMTDEQATVFNQHVDRLAAMGLTGAALQQAASDAFQRRIIEDSILKRLSELLESDEFALRRGSK